MAFAATERQWQKNQSFAIAIRSRGRLGPAVPAGLRASVQG